MATIYDVARTAGVSAKTVSRVLNGDAPVGTKTRQRVTEAMEALSYVPSSAARVLRSNQADLVGVISGAISEAATHPELAGLPEIHIVKGVQEHVHASGQTLLMADTGGQARNVPGLLRTFSAHRVSGIVYIAPYHQRIELPPLAGARLVIANGHDEAGTPCVVPDDYSGQKALVAGLIARGHRHIAYLQLPPELEACRHRTRAYRDALREAGIALDPELLRPADVHAGSPDARFAALHGALDAVLAASPRPTVICCGNDRMAVAAYGILRSRGLRIPEDISIAGYDDYRLITETLFPRLTSVVLPYQVIGQRAAELLTGGCPAGTRIEAGGDVIWRESVANAPA